LRRAAASTALPHVGAPPDEFLHSWVVVRNTAGPDLPPTVRVGFRREVIERWAVGHKPSSVCPPKRADGQLSGMAVASHLTRPTRSSDDPAGSLPIWPCSDWGLPCHACYQARGGLFNPPFHPYPWNKKAVCFSVALSVASRAPALPGSLPSGARLSSARHSHRHAATITPYRHPAENYRSWKGQGKPSPVPSARASAAGAQAVLRQAPAAAGPVGSRREPEAVTFAEDQLL